MPKRLPKHYQTTTVLLTLRKAGRLPDIAVLANLLGYSSQVTVQLWFEGKDRPPLRLLPKIAEIARVNPLTILPCWLSDEDPKNAQLYADLGMQLVRNDPTTIEALRVTLTEEDEPPSLP